MRAAGRPATQARAAARAALDRHTARLAARILDSPQPIVWLCGIAGTGKSALLGRLAAGRGRRPVLLDDPSDGTLQAALTALPPASTGRAPRLVVASRPGSSTAQVLLSHLAYGRVARLDDHDLFLPCTTTAGRRDGVLADTGGWPMLVAAAATGRAAEVRALLPEFLRQHVLPGLAVREALALLVAASFPPAVAARALTAGTAATVPLLRIGPDGARAGGRWIAAALREVHAGPQPLPALLEQALVAFHVEHGDPTEAIVALNAAGRAPGALAVFERCGGMLYGFRQGFESLSRALASFPPGAEAASDALLGARVFELFKAGRAREALGRLEALHPGLPVDLRRLPSPYRPYPLLLRVNIAVDLDEVLPPDVVKSWARLEPLLPPDDHLARGVLYNTMALGFLRADEPLQARQLATEALEAYRRGGSPYLVHCMLIHLADVALRESRLADAAAHLAEARAELGRSGFAFNSEHEILDVFDARLAYEEARFGDCPGDHARILAALVRGDSWPGLIRAMVGYAPFVEFWRAGLAAALATAEQCSLALARRHGAVEDRGLALLGIRLLQIARRHFEASTRIAELDLEPAGAVSPYLAAEEGLLRLRARLLEHGPAEDAGAAAKHVAALPILTRRQRISLGLLQAFLHHRRGDSRLSRRHLSVALRAAQASGAVGVLLEDAEILERLLPALIADRGAGEASLKEFAGRLIARLKRLPASGLRGRAAAGLSRQEHRVLAYLADGCSNKEIARALALSESAVKFHLRNLYRKLGAHRRGEALEHARERGVLA